MASVSVSGAGTYVSAPVFGDRSGPGVPGPAQGGIVVSPTGDYAAAVVGAGDASGMVYVNTGLGSDSNPGAAVAFGQGGSDPTIIGTPGLNSRPVVDVSPTGEHAAVVLDNGGAFGMVYVNTGLGSDSNPGAAVAFGQGGSDPTIIGTPGLHSGPVVDVSPTGEHAAVVLDNGDAFGMVYVNTGRGSDSSPGVAVGAGQGGSDPTIIGIGAPATDSSNGAVALSLPVGQGLVVVSPTGDHAAVLANGSGQSGMVYINTGAGDDSSPGALVVAGDRTISTADPAGAAPAAPMFATGSGADTVQAPGAVASSLSMGNATLLGAGGLSTVDPFAAATGGGLVDMGADSAASSALVGSFVQDQSLSSLVAPALDTHAAAPATGSVLSLDDGLTTIQLQGIDHKLG